MSSRQKKRKASDVDNNINQINMLSVENLKRYGQNYFSSTYGFFCLLDILKNGSVGEINDALQKYIDTNSVSSISPSDNETFKNTSMVFNASQYTLSKEYKNYLAHNQVLNESIDQNALQQKIVSLNDQLSEMTNHKIKNPLDPADFNDDFVMLLINVLYFRACWRKQFEETDTIRMPFMNGLAKQTVDMMRSWDDDHMYYEDKNYQFLSMRYDVYPYHMVIALPKKYGIVNNKFDHGLDSEFNINEVINNMEKHAITKLMIPRFRIEREEDLKEMCLRMGLGKMFEPNNDFDRMFDSSTCKKYISKIKQKTFCEINESGTEAAAVTIAVMTRECFVKPSERKVKFIANHPFSLFIMGPNDIILFAGRFFGY